MTLKNAGKLQSKDQAIAKFWNWIPWVAFPLVVLPAPLIFFLLYLSAQATETAAVFLLLGAVFLGAGAILGFITVLVLLLLKRRWLARLRDRLALDGITADEVAWFTPELTSAERKAFKELRQHNPALADAYSETLAARLAATRIISRTKNEMLLIDRRLRRARSLYGPETDALIRDLTTDRNRLADAQRYALEHLTHVKARLQTIEATSSRILSESETDMMLRRLAASQERSPLALEMAQLERQFADVTSDSMTSLSSNLDDLTGGVQPNSGRQ